MAFALQKPVKALIQRIRTWVSWYRQYGKLLLFDNLTRPTMTTKPQTPFEAKNQKGWKTPAPSPLNEMAERYLPNTEPPAVLSSPEELNGMAAVKPEHAIIVQQRLNELRSVNSSLIRLNAQLRVGGYLIGCVETTQLRKKRVLKQLPWPFKKLLYGMDVLLKRAWSRLPVLKKMYFRPASGRSWAMSEVEVLGRLCACGFYPDDTVEEKGLLYFFARKVATIEKAPKAGTGPVIPLSRVGKGGKQITVYKFRTMYPYSEYLQEFVFNNNGLQEGGKFKDDPRITPTGRIMRKYWVDELPNLISICRGQMKLFGLRPISEHYLSLYPESFQQLRKRFKPGLVPPEYVDLPTTIDEIVESESRYLEAYQRQPFQTDLRYMSKAFYNIFIKKVRSH